MAPTLGTDIHLIVDDVDHAYISGVSWHKGKGGRAKGYIGGQYVYAHRLIAMVKLQRSLRDDEIVGFANGNPLDCTRENLVIGTRAELAKFVWEKGDVEVIKAGTPEHTSILSGGHNGEKDS